MAFGRCKKQAYCNQECQRPHWKAHKKECVKVEQLAKEETKKMPLTWKLLKEFGNALGEELEVRYVTERPGLFHKLEYARTVSEFPKPWPCKIRAKAFQILFAAKS